MLRWFFRKKEEKNLLCSMCKQYKAIRTKDMGDEFCFVCLAKRGREVLALESPIYHPKNTQDNTPKKNYRGHDSKCVQYINTCYHLEHQKDKCPYKDQCEFINPVMMQCSADCPIKLQK